MERVGVDIAVPNTLTKRNKILILSMLKKKMTLNRENTQTRPAVFRSTKKGAIIFVIKSLT